jgi:hypothetical protein
VDPTDPDSVQEIQSSIGLGMSGLKLHPLSQGWVDKINSDETKSVLQAAGDLQIPVIFDVPNKGVALDITAITQEARQESESPVNVILGHTGFDYSSPEIFDCLKQDGMYAETSGMRGKDVELFFEHVTDVPGWEEKLLFGTDHNYFSVLQAADLITFLLTKRFAKILEEKNHPMSSTTIAGKILGTNALELLPSAWQGSINVTGKKKYKTTLDIMQQALKEFISKDGQYIKIDLGINPNDSKTLQIITFGYNNTKHSFVIFQSEDFRDIILEPIPSSLQKANFMDLVDKPLQSYIKSKRRLKTLKLNDLNALLNKIISLE